VERPQARRSGVCGQERRKLGEGADGDKKWGSMRSMHLALARVGCLEHRMQYSGDAEWGLCEVFLD
jgi:hypothetical protein